MDTKEYGKMFRRILTLEEGRVPAKNAEGLKIGGQKRRVTRNECTMRIMDFRQEENARRMRAVPKEDGDLLRKH